jgi:hypothetical protein
MVIGDGTDNFSLDKHLRRYKEAYMLGLEKAKES